MASGKKGKGARKVRAATSSVMAKKGLPWNVIVPVLVVVVFAGGVFGYVYVQYADKKAKADALVAWTPSDTNKDPSTKIAGVVKKDYAPGMHIQPTQRVAYDQSPPFGGPHDNYWATCTGGVVYPKAVRSENMVHALEHGAVWITYNPTTIQGAALDQLKQKVAGQDFLMLSPYPGLDKPISLQSWGHQLKVDSPGDPRIDQFVQSLRRNQYGVYPEVGATCNALGPGQFDPSNPPPFDPTPPGPDAVPMTGGTNASQQPSMPPAPAPAPQGSVSSAPATQPSGG
jgi:hypothetical protein